MTWTSRSYWFEGDTGPIGPMGEQGERGVQGEQGIRVVSGPIVLRGLQGTTREWGPAGPWGDSGECGPVAANGKRLHVFRRVIIHHLTKRYSVIY